MNRTLLCSLMELFPLGREPGPSSQPPDDNRLTESPDCESPPVELQYVHIFWLLPPVFDLQIDCD